jgi:hypothetical protein
MNTPDGPAQSTLHAVVWVALAIVGHQVQPPWRAEGKDAGQSSVLTGVGWDDKPTRPDVPPVDRHPLRLTPTPSHADERDFQVQLADFRLTSRRPPSVTALSHLGGGVRRDGGIWKGGLTCERDDNCANKCQTKPDHRNKDVPGRPAETLVQ